MLLIARSLQTVSISLIYPFSHSVPGSLHRGSQTGTFPYYLHWVLCTLTELASSFGGFNCFTLQKSGPGLSLIQFHILSYPQPTSRGQAEIFSQCMSISSMTTNSSPTLDDARQSPDPPVFLSLTQLPLSLM